jgi:hypothetical protein
MAARDPEGSVMASRGKRKAHPQLIAIEVILVAAFVTGAYFLAAHFGEHAPIVLFLAGAAADRALTLILRHRNKRLLPPMPRITTQPRKTPARRRA